MSHPQILEASPVPDHFMDRGVRAATSILIKCLLRVVLLCLPMSVTVTIFAADAHPVINIWPKGAPDESSDLNRERVLAGVKNRLPERIYFVSEPTLTLYPATANANGCGVIVCPGGGYNILAWNKEGLEIAEWLNSLGVSAFVLKYRVPRRDEQSPQKWPLQDAQRAIRLVRKNAVAWRVDPQRLGVLGFSAGGNLTIMTGTRWDESTYPPVDDADRIDCRPDFLIPIYAAYLGNKQNDTRLSPELRLSNQTPPTFMAVTWDDENRGLHAALLFAELKRRGVPAELHVFSKGGHGYGMRPTGDPVAGWPKLCGDWLRTSGWMSAAESNTKRRAKSPSLEEPSARRSSQSPWHRNAGG